MLIGAGVCLLLVGAVAATAGPSIYRDFFAAPAVLAPTLSADQDTLQPTGSTLDPTTLAGEWVVADGSEAGYRVDEVLNGTNVTVTGRTDDVTGSFAIDPSGLTLAAAEISVDVASISTDSAQRDSYFRDQALRASEFPNATFTLTTPVTLDAVPDSGGVVEAEAVGNLTIAGVTQEVTATVQVRSDGIGADIAGSIPITFADFGVTAPTLGFVAVEPDGFVEFQLRASAP